MLQVVTITCLITDNCHLLHLKISAYTAYNGTIKNRKGHLFKKYVSPKSHPRYFVGKRTAQKDTIIGITNDSKVNSNCPYRWSPASLTFNNYFYLLLYLYITRITINNNTPHLQSSKYQNMELTGGL